MEEFLKRSKSPMLVLSYVSLAIIAAFKEATVAFHEHSVPNCALLATQRVARNPQLRNISFTWRLFDFGTTGLMNVIQSPMQSGPDNRGVPVQLIGRVL